MTENKLILHIGQTKTGTTSIQSFLHANQKQLELSGIYYARRPNAWTSHRYLFYLINSCVDNLTDASFKERHALRLREYWKNSTELKTTDEYWDFFKGNLVNDSCNISIVSEELLWELGKFEHLAKKDMIQLLANHLHQIFKPKNITIVAALRHHSEWLESWHNQMVKDQGNQMNILPFFEQEQAYGSLNYSNNLNDWLDIFPEANLRVVDFKKSLISNRPIGIMFLDILGLLDKIERKSFKLMTYPERLQEAIHPMLQAYIIRKKPNIDNIKQYKQKIRIANKMTQPILMHNGIDYAYTVLNKNILKKCDEISKLDHTEHLNLPLLSSNIRKKRTIPRLLPQQIVESFDKIFK